MLKLFAIFDTKAMAFLPPFVLPNVDMALREFTNCANDPSHAFCRNADDFILSELGIFDDIDGVITPHSPHKIIGYAMAFKTPIKDNQS